LTNYKSIDLHTHSTASDGQLTPSELIQAAAAMDISVLALTDHDSVEGIDEAWSVAKQLGVTFVPGVELSTSLAVGECHILGYFLDHHSPELQRALTQFQESRQTRGHHMVERLGDLGFNLSWKQVQQVTRGGSITRAHIAEALLNAGYVSSRQEAFDLYIGKNGPAYVQRFSLSPEEAVQLIRRAHGVPVLAHPTFVDSSREWTGELSKLIPWPFLERLLPAGLLGLEVYYGEYTADISERLLAIAKHYGLIVTGGSDFHGNDETPPLGCVAVPDNVVDTLYQQARLCGSPWL